MTYLLALALALTVHDGDSVRLGSERMRIAGIDAPEFPDSPPCRDARRETRICDLAAAVAAKARLQSLLASGDVQIERRGLDRYGRTLVVLRVRGVSVGCQLVREGLAVARWGRCE